MYKKIEDVVWHYAPGRMTLTRVLAEALELGEGVLRMDIQNIREEIGDTAHFLQLWLYWRFGINGKPWRISHGSIRKFAARIEVWEAIYQVAGLPESTPVYIGNYKKLHKVVEHLGRYGVNAEVAAIAYMVVVVQPSN